MNVSLSAAYRSTYLRNDLSVVRHMSVVNTVYAIVSKRKNGRAGVERER